MSKVLVISTSLTVNTNFVGALSERLRAIGNRPYDRVHSWWRGLPHDDSVQCHKF